MSIDYCATDMVTGIPLPQGTPVLVWALDGNDEGGTTPMVLPVAATLGDRWHMELRHGRGTGLAWSVLQRFVALTSTGGLYVVPDVLRDVQRRLGYEHTVVTWGIMAQATYDMIGAWGIMPGRGGGTHSPYAQLAQELHDWLHAVYQYKRESLRTRGDDPMWSLYPGAFGAQPLRWRGLSVLYDAVQADPALVEYVVGAMVVLSFMQATGTPVRPSTWLPITLTGPASDDKQREALEGRQAMAQQQIAALYKEARQ